MLLARAGTPNLPRCPLLPSYPTGLSSCASCGLFVQLRLEAAGTTAKHISAALGLLMNSEREREILEKYF